MKRHRRLGRDGAPMTVQEWNDIKREVGHRCFVCRRRRRLVVDHDHDTGFVRAPACREDNLIEGLLKKIGIRTYDQLMQWAHGMAALRMMPGLAMGDDWKPKRRRKAS
jgi:hypothetical protein